MSQQVNAVTQAVKQQQAVFQKAQQSAFQEVSVLKQKIAIQEQVKAGSLSAASATQKMAEADIFAATGSRALAKQLAATQNEYKKNEERLRAIAQAEKDATGATSGLHTALSKLGTAAGILGIVISAAALVKLLYDAVKAGIAYNATLEQQRIGIASIIAATSKIADAQGRTLTGAEKFNAAQRLSAELMVKIQEAALRTTATSEQLVDAFQSGIGPLKAAGLSLDQSLDATVRIVQAASALGVPMHQVAQEVRAIAEGSIDQNARLAITLEISKEQVAALKAQGKLYEFIVQKTESFAAAGVKTEHSFSGLSSSIRDVLQQILGLQTGTLFSKLLVGMESVLVTLTAIRNKLAETGKTGLEKQIDTITRQIDALEKRRASGDTPGIAESIIAQIVGSPADLGARIMELRDQLADLEVEFKALSSAAKGGSSALDTFKVSSADANKVSKELREAMRTTASAFADFDLNVAKMTGNLGLFRQASLEAINADFSKRLAEEAGNVDQIAEIEAQKALATKQLLIDGTTFYITKKQEELLMALSVEQGKADAAEAGLSAQRAILVATQQRIQAESELAAQATDKTARYLVLQQQSADITQKLAVLEAQAAAASSTATQRRINLANGLISVLQTQLAQQQQLAQGGDNAAAANAAQLQKSIQGLVTERDKDIAAARKQGGVHAAAMQTIETTSLKAAQVMGTAFLAAYDKITEATKRRIALQESAFTTESAGLSKQTKQSQSVLSILQAELKVLQTRDGTYEKQLETMQRINGEEKELAAIALQRTEQELTAAKVSVANAELLSAQLRTQIEIGKQQGIDVTELTQKYTELEKARLAAWANVTEVEGEVIEAQTQLTTTAIEAEQRIRDLNKIKLDEALLTVNDLRDGFRDVIRGVFEGSGDLDDVIKRFGEGMGLKLIEGIAFGKGKLEDQVLIPNFSEVFGEGGIVGSILQGAGTNLGSLFGGAFGSSAGNTLQQETDSLLTEALSGSDSGLENSGAAAGETWGTAFGIAAAAVSLAFLAESETALGWGTAIGTVVGAAAMAYLTAGNQQAAAAGAMVGGALGHIFLDPFFKATTTRGTIIRRGVKGFLEEIAASFAVEISTGKYFFEDTKALAEKMFGGDFLKASKATLTDKAGPEMAKQLQALGAFITGNLASKEGKNIEQSGTTFGNMLIHNLGIEALPDAIDEIVQKAGIAFDDLAKKLTVFFEQGKITEPFYKDAIEGAVSLFFGDLPDAINVSKIALKSFTDDGIFSLTEFEKKLKETTDVFNTVTKNFTDAIKNSTSGTEAAEMFGKQLKEGLDNLALDAFLKDFIDNRLFAGIDLSDGLSSEEMVLLKERTKLAREEVERLKLVLGGTFDEAKLGASGLVDQIKALNAQLVELAQKRVQVRIDLIQQLTQIGSLSASESIAAQMQEFAGIVEHALAVIADTRIGRSGDTALQHSSDAELQQMFDALGQMSNLTVQQFEEFRRQREAALQIEIQAIQAALQVKIAAIQEELSKHIAAIQEALTARIQAIQDALQAQVDAIHEEYEAKREAVQKAIEKLREEQDEVRRVFDLRREALEKELQTAQAFKQVAESLQQTINGLMSSGSPFSGPEELAFLQRQADDIRNQIKTAKPEDRPELFQQLAALLQSQLQVGQGFLDPVAFARLFESVILELESLRDRAAEEAAKIEDIQKKIEANTKEMEVLLKAIDDKIAKLEKYLQQLAEDENNAIAAAQKAAAEKIEIAQKAAAAEIAAAQAAAAVAIALAQDVAAKEIAEAQRKAAEDITAEQKRTEDRLIVLADARDKILREQMARIEEQKAILMEQLDPLLESARQLVDINKTLVSIEDSLFGFLNETTAESSSVQAQASPPAALNGGRHAALSPTGSSAGGAAPIVINLSQPVTLHWQASGNSEEDARRVMRAMQQQTVDDVRSGPLGQEIVKRVRGQMGVPA